MNVRELLAELSNRYPLAQGVHHTGDSFQVLLDNGWFISLGYGQRHYSSNRIPLPDIKDATVMEVAIFKPNMTWFIAEGMVVMDNEEGSKSGVFSYQTSEQVLAIFEYIAGMDPRPP